MDDANVELSSGRTVDLSTDGGNEGSIENEFLRVSPAILKFPQNDPSLHLGKLVLWNKTKGRVDFRVMAPHSKHFSLFYEKVSMIPNSFEFNI